MLLAENTLLLVVDFQERLMPAMRNCDELGRKAGALIKGCRLLDIPILTTQQYTKGLGATVPDIEEALGEFEPIEKITFSCLGESAFVNKLSQFGEKNILVVGIEAHICVQQTVLDLLGKGYNVYVIADCVGSRSETDYIYAGMRMQQAGAVLTTMESVLFEFLISAEHPKRKEISNLIK